MKEKFYSMLRFLALRVCVCTFTACGSDSKNDDEGGGGGGEDATSIVGYWYAAIDTGDYGGYVDEAYEVDVFTSNTWQTYDLYKVSGYWVKVLQVSGTYTAKGSKLSMKSSSGETAEVTYTLSSGKLVLNGVSLSKLSGSLKSSFDNAMDANDY